MAQFVNLYAEQEYTLKFTAKRASNVDVWVQILNGGSFESSPSFSSLLDGAYTQLPYTFVANDPTSGQVISVPNYLVAGSVAVMAWFDSVEIIGEEVLSSSKFIATKENATIFKYPTGGNDNFGRFPSNEFLWTFHHIYKKCTQDKDGNLFSDYYNIKDGRQVSYIEVIGASSELENLQPVPEIGKKITSGQTSKSSTTGRTGGA